MKPYKYTAEHGGEHDTRADAIAAATIAARERARIRFDTTPTPDGYRKVIGRVYAYEPHVCGYCGRTFLHEDDHENHQPCPWWEYDEGDREDAPS